MKMLEYTFQHLNGFGDLKEKELWRNKVFSWSDFEKLHHQQLSFGFDEPVTILSESKNRLLSRDVTYFVRQLPRNSHFLIPHSFPEETIFLDIETTGLSLYYDTITIVGWSKLDKYYVHIAGDEVSQEHLIQSIGDAKCLITFNGSIFDLPFLRKAFKGVNMPVCHLDLRFFCKRVGYTGGQKKIEDLLGFHRPLDLTSINGYEATLLWHKYKKGDLESLRQLIEYNVSDINGMKHIFERLTVELIEKEQLPISLSSIFHFSQMDCKYKFNNELFDGGIYLRKFSGLNGPSITIDKLKNVSLEKIVGIDLTGSEKRATGWSMLQSNFAITKSILTDQELIDETVKHVPSIISIDSPLSIPIGRTSFFDDDPTRDEFGITRECERIMAKRGIKSYPCLIPTMQKLTQRGMKLAAIFRKMGYVVIESYPGAAQDIMGIPRKGKSLEFLIKGLKEFGILGSFDKPGVTHDEIDAITSAIVGYFYLANQYEALGNEIEGYLIIPKINSPN